MRIALDYGMVLKDASAYNIQFHLGRPVLIDSLSFEKYKEGYHGLHTDSFVSISLHHWH